MARSMGRDRNYILNEALDNYIGLSSMVEKAAAESPHRNGLIDNGDADAMVISRMSAKATEDFLFHATHTDTDEAPRLMRNGPFTYLDPPVPLREMDESKIGAQFPILEPAATNNKLLIFLSSKGGAGVTTLACNFAVSLAQNSGKRVLLIDLNLPLGDAALNLGIRAKFTIMNAFQNLNRLDSTYLSTLLEEHSSGLFVLAAPSDLAGGEASRKDIYTLLAVAHSAFDFVVVDAGTTLDAKHVYSFDQSTTIYLVTQIGIPELRNANRLIAKFPTMGGPKLEIVINRFDPRTQVIDETQLTNALTRPARWRIPNDYAAVRQMQNTATPLTSGKSPISLTINQMTKCICDQSCTPERKKGFSLFGFRITRG
ncbi:MAG: AAA family ATPase [Terracidiphilus sp.]